MEIGPASRPRARTWAVATLVALLAGACAPGAADYYPLDAGRTFEYHQRVEVRGEPTVQRRVVTNLGPATWQGRRVHVQRVQDGVLHLFVRDAGGVRRIATRSPGQADALADGEYHYLLPAPLRSGRHWSLESRLRLVESRTFAREDRLAPRLLPVTLVYTVEALDDTVQVPAGRFTACVRIRATGRTHVPVDRGNARAAVAVEHVDWYAPGIGRVKSQREETSDSPFLHDGRFVLELARVRG